MGTTNRRTGARAGIAARSAAAHGQAGQDGQDGQVLEQALHDVFGLRSLRPGQREVVDRILAGRSTLAVMPTGAGKSLCYQLPAVLMEGCAVVVSPLIALMKDQCEKLLSHGVMAVQLNSHCSAREIHAAESAISEGSARIVLTTPERMTQTGFVALLRNRGITLLCVDEAHCISQWGHDFRPAFLEIETALQALGCPTVLALTATASAAVSKEIMARLNIPADGCVDTGTYRPNLHYAVEPLEDETARNRRLLELVAETEGSGIVYTATVKVAEEVHSRLRAAGHGTGLYHGRRTAAERRAAQDAFMSGADRVMVATNAFGMGIDKPDIRFVVHYQIPSGLDAYYQESGRAGRDGEPATCALLFLPRDKAVQQFFMAGRYPDARELEAVYTALLHGDA
ncbi:MAG: RecQ family ATP-dependent DNA helicase, partial [Burkholderiales bacterium]